MLKINPENFISFSALVGKTNSPESVLAMASFKKYSCRENGPRKTCRYVLRMQIVSCVVTDVGGGHIIIWRGERFSEASQPCLKECRRHWW